MLVAFDEGGVGHSNPLADQGVPKVILNATIPLTFSLLISQGCPSIESSDVSSVFRFVQRSYGPPIRREASYFPDLTTVIGATLRHDFNGDGIDEIVLLFDDQGLDLSKIRTILDLNGTVCRGFLVLTHFERRWWPVCFYFNAYRGQFSFSADKKWPGIVLRGGRDHMHAIWFWQQMGGWQAIYKIETIPKSSKWRRQPKMQAVYPNPAEN